MQAHISQVCLQPSVPPDCRVAPSPVPRWYRCVVATAAASGPCRRTASATQGTEVPPARAVSGHTCRLGAGVCSHLARWHLAVMVCGTATKTVWTAVVAAQPSAHLRVVHEVCSRYASMRPMMVVSWLSDVGQQSAWSNLCYKLTVPAGTSCHWQRAVVAFRWYCLA
jgi:hypothetical protein